ncbi:unnamed protein product [Ascophyllum nodosum]
MLAATSGEEIAGGEGERKGEEKEEEEKDEEARRAGNQIVYPASPSRFGDSNTEPGGQVCCCSRLGFRISYCELSQVALAAIIVTFFVVITVSTLY